MDRFDVIGAVGTCLLGAGFYLISPALGLVVVGLILFGLGIFGGDKK